MVEKNNPVKDNKEELKSKILEVLEKIIQEVKSEKLKQSKP